MKLNCKMIINKIINFIKDNALILFGATLLILLSLIIAISSILNDTNNSSFKEDIELCSMTTNNNAEDFNNTYSDYISLTAPIVKIDGYPYRCVGSLFLGYDGEDCYLYYPTTYTNNNIRSYEYRSIQCEFSRSYNISIAVQYIQSSGAPINVNFRFFIYREPNNKVLELKHNIYDISYYDYNCYVDDINPFDGSLNGYSTFSDYLCYSNDINYRFLMRLYNVGNLSVEPNTYNINDRYNPCLHFNDFSGYNNGYNNGYAYGYGIGEQKGEEYGMQVGYDRGYSEGVTSDGLFGFLSGSVENLLDIEIFPQFSIGDALWLGVGIVLFGVFMKIFRF